jgi:tetratricopeptide (TPR) repeat protein
LTVSKYCIKIVNMEPDWLDKIDDYLDGKLSAEARAEMETALQNDPSLRRELRISRQERIAMDLLRDEKARAEFKRWTVDTPEPVRHVGAKDRRWRTWGIAGLLLLVAATAWLLYSGTDSEKIPGTQPPPPQAQDSAADAPIAYQPPAQHAPRNPPTPDGKRTRPTPHTQSDDPIRIEAQDLAVNFEKEAQELFDSPGTGVLRDNNALTKLGEASALYKKEDYEQVVKVLATLPSDDKDYIRALYLKALALFKIKRYDVAADAFAEVYKSPRNEYSLEPKWREALCLYADGGRQKARLREVLNLLLVEDFPAAKKQNARAILDKIR